MPAPLFSIVFTCCFDAFGIRKYQLESISEKVSESISEYERASVRKSDNEMRQVEPPPGGRVPAAGT